MKISVDESSVGVGKTHAAIERAVTLSGLWLFAVERIDSINELAARIKAMAKSKNVQMKVVAISSEPDESKMLRGSSVRTEVEALAKKYENGHVIAICSHSAMMMTDFTDFTRWHFVCDEVPGLLDITKKQTKLDLPFFEKYFELEKLTTGSSPWSLFKPTKAGLKLNGSDLLQDESHKHLAKLHLVTKLAHEGKIAKYPVTTLTRFENMEGDHVFWVWWSLLSIKHFEPFKSVLFLASRFMDSMTRKIIDQWNQDVEWTVISRPSDRQFVTRNVSIKYYAHRTSNINFLTSATGKKHLAAIAVDIKNTTNSSKLIWSANAKFVDALKLELGAHFYHRPKQAGTDLLMDNTSAAMIYSAQPAGYVMEVLKIFALTKADWVESIEHETILQFVSRCSVRDANSSDDVQIFVYNEEQADYLERFFSSQSHNTVSSSFVDLNLEYPASIIGRPTKTLTAKQQKTKDEARRKKKNAAQKLRRQKAKQAAKTNAD